MKVKLFLGFLLLAATALLLLAGVGTLYRGQFVDGGYSPAFIGDGSGLTNIPAAAVIGSGVATNGIQMLNGYGTNTTLLLSPKLADPWITNGNISGILTGRVTLATSSINSTNNYGNSSTATLATNAVNSTNNYGNSATATLATNAVNSTNNYGNSATATLATNAINATNIYGAGLTTVTNAATTVATTATNALAGQLAAGKTNMPNLTVTNGVVMTNALISALSVSNNLILNGATINTWDDVTNFFAQTGTAGTNLDNLTVTNGVRMTNVITSASTNYNAVLTGTTSIGAGHTITNLNAAGAGTNAGPVYFGKAAINGSVAIHDALSTSYGTITYDGVSIQADKPWDGTHTGNGAGLTSLTAANIAAGTAGINITGNALSATTATTATLGDNPVAFWAGFTTWATTNAPASNQWIRATSATTFEATAAPTGGDVTQAGQNNFTGSNSFANDTSFAGDLYMDVDKSLKDEYGFTRMDWAADRTKVFGPTNLAGVEFGITNNTYSSPNGIYYILVNDDGTIIFNGTSSFDTFTASVGSFTNTMFMSNQPPATTTIANSQFLWNSNNVAMYRVTYDNSGNPIATNLLGGTGTGSTETVAAGTNGIAVVEAPAGTFTVHHTGNFDLITATQMNIGTAYITNLVATSTNAFAAIHSTNFWGTLSTTNLPFIPQYGSAALTNWANATLGFLPFYDGSDFHGIYAPNESPTNALVYDSGNGLWRLGTNANIRMVGAFTGNGDGLTNIPIASIVSPGVIVTNGLSVPVTMSNSIFSLATTASSPGSTELATAGWVRTLLQSGQVQYNGPSTNSLNATNIAGGVWLYTNAVPAHFVRTNGSIVANMYCGATSITNLPAGSTFSGPMVVSVYLWPTAGGGLAAMSVKPELYYSYDNGATALLGDYDCGAQVLTIGVTNQYTFVISFPTITFASDATVYRVLKVTSVSGSSPVLHVLGGVGTPSQINYNSSVSALSSATATIATNAINATNIFGDGLVTMTNVATTVMASYGGTTNVVNDGSTVSFISTNGIAGAGLYFGNDNATLKVGSAATPYVVLSADLSGAATAVNDPYETNAAVTLSSSGDVTFTGIVTLPSDALAFSQAAGDYDASPATTLFATRVATNPPSLLVTGAMTGNGAGLTNLVAAIGTNDNRNFSLSAPAPTASNSPPMFKFSINYTNTHPGAGAETTNFVNSGFLIDAYDWGTTNSGTYTYPFSVLLNSNPVFRLSKHGHAYFDTGSLYLTTSGSAFLFQSCGINLYQATDLATSYDGVVHRTLKVQSGVAGAMPVIAGEQGSGTNGKGKSLMLAGGRGTGNTNGGSVIIATATTGASGTSLNGYSQRYHPGESTTTLSDSSATSIAQITCNTNTYTGGTLFYTISAKDASDAQALTGTARFSVVNKGGVFSFGNVADPATSQSLAATTGTLTNYFTLAAAASGGSTNFVIQANSTSSLTETNLWCQWQLHLNSDWYGTVTAY